MFFAARYSVMLGAIYRSAMVRNIDGLLEVPTPSGSVARVKLGPLLNLDTSGVGGRFAVAIGL